MVCGKGYEMTDSVAENFRKACGWSSGSARKRDMPRSAFQNLTLGRDKFNNRICSKI